MNHLTEFQLNEYLDGLLDPATQTAVEAHLTACNTCQAALNDLQTQTQPESAAWLRPLLFLQSAGAIGMVVWLWPVIWGWLTGMETAVTATFSALQPVQLNLWSRVLEWETAVIQQFQLVRPTIDLAAGQWALLIGLALIAWLAGNKFLLTNE